MSAMDGVLYMLDMAGKTLHAAEQQISQLMDQNQQLMTLNTELTNRVSELTQTKTQL